MPRKTLSLANQRTSDPGATAESATISTPLSAEASFSLTIWCFGDICVPRPQRANKISDLIDASRHRWRTNAELRPDFEVVTKPGSSRHVKSTWYMHGEHLVFD
jgi:hypothetical protein